MYILQTLWLLYSDSFTTTLHFPSGPISLATLASLSSARQAPLLQSRLLPVMYHVHTLLIHRHTLYIHVYTLYTGTTLYHHDIWHQELVCTALVIGMYYAIVQESAILYIHVSERYIPLKTGFARVVGTGSFPVAFPQKHVYKLLCISELCLAMFVHEKVKMLQESYHPGKASFERYITLWNLYIQNGWFLYDSIVHHYHKGCT